MLLPSDKSGNQLPEDSVLPLPICPCSRPGGNVLRSCDKSGNQLPEDSVLPLLPEARSVPPLLPEARSVPPLLPGASS